MLFMRRLWVAMCLARLRRALRRVLLVTGGCVTGFVSVCRLVNVGLVHARAAICGISRTA